MPVRDQSGSRGLKILPNGNQVRGNPHQREKEKGEPGTTPEQAWLGHGLSLKPNGGGKGKKEEKKR